MMVLKYIVLIITLFNNFILLIQRKDEWDDSYDKRMNFPFKIIDAVCKVRDDLKKLDFIIDYRLSPEEPY